MDGYSIGTWLNIVQRDFYAGFSIYSHDGDVTSPAKKGTAVVALSCIY